MNISDDLLRPRFRQSLYSGTSQDGIHFSDEEPVFIDGDDTEGMPGYPSVPAGLSYDNGTIRMYYSIPSVGIKSARSEDRVATWVKEEGVRIHYGTDPTAIPCRWKNSLFYVDTNTKIKGQRIFFAVSDDGNDFSIAPPCRC
jgi:hypothetical protein